MNARQTLGWNVRALRVERGLSQEKLALAAGLDRAYTGRIERGTENLTIASIEAIANVLDVSISRLFATPPDDELPTRLRAGRKAKV